jgi:hypothetical protein
MELQKELKVLVLEKNAPGGQAGSSSRIENYLGFPMGISGEELSNRAFVQAEKFGAHIAIAKSAIGLKSNLPPYTVELEGGGSVRGSNGHHRCGQPISQTRLAEPFSVRRSWSLLWRYPRRGCCLPRRRGSGRGRREFSRAGGSFP